VIVDDTVTFTWIRLIGLDAFSVTLVGENVAVGPGGETVSVIVSGPAKLLMLVMLRKSDESEEPGEMISFEMSDSDCNEKVGKLVNDPVCTVSGFGVVEPLAIVTQTPPATLV